MLNCDSKLRWPSSEIFVLHFYALSFNGLTLTGSISSCTLVSILYYFHGHHQLGQRTGLPGKKLERDIFETLPDLILVWKTNWRTRYNGEFCVAVDPATRTAVYWHSWLKALAVKLSRPSGRSWSYTGLIVFKPRRLKRPKRGWAPMLVSMRNLLPDIQSIAWEQWKVIGGRSLAPQVINTLWATTEQLNWNRNREITAFWNNPNCAIVNAS